MIQLVIISIILFAIEFGYIKLADKLNIIDKPNERSSHTKPTIRGGGIIFSIGWLLFFFLYGFQFPWFTLGLVLLTFISFLDDLGPISNKVRLLFHFTAFTLCFYQLGLFEMLAWWQMMLVYIVAVGCLNAINFMDGINGMTGLYAIAIFLPILIFKTGNPFINPISILLISIVVFGFFNFRKKAVCFAGDVGSVSIAYIIIFFTLGFMFHRWQIVDGQFSLKPNVYTEFSFQYILLLALYGVDAILTLAHRLLLKENIFKAHRKHLYQYLVNEMKWAHLLVAFIYAAIQFGISYWILQGKVSISACLICILIFSVIYIFLKIRIQKKFISV